MKYQIKRLFTFVIVIITSTCWSAYADSVCDLALKSGAFNTSDYAETSKILQKKKDDVCDSEYTSLAEATSAAKQSGGEIGYEAFSFKASDATKTGSGKYSIKDSRFCMAKAEQIDSFTSVRAKKIVADLGKR
jgi:hypothetical protein